jgi:hypothetical protein
MISAIVEKLQKELAQPIVSEPQVTYLLVEIRKVIDGEPDSQQWKALKLYCDWTVHTELTYESRIRPFLQKIETFVEGLWTPTSTGISSTVHEAIKEIVYLDEFRRELLSFLKQHSLPEDVASDEHNWRVFLKQYAQVIQDGSMAYSGNSLREITRLTFTAIPRPEDGAMPFVIKWTIETKTKGEYSLVLNPAGNLVGSILLRSHA